MVLCFPTSSI